MGCLLLLRLQYDAPPRPSASAGTNLWTSAVEGVRAVSGNLDLALIIGLAAAQALTRGALTVLTVVVAIDLLGAGEPGVGILNAAIGAGAVVGSLAASLLVGTRRLGAWFAIGVALWGTPIALIGVFPEQAAALGLLACVGAGNALIDLAGFTLLARLAPDDVLARVFGVLESVVALFIGVGAVVASLLIDLSGVRTALVVVGLLCPACAALSWRRLRGMDRSIGVRDHEIETLQAVAMLNVLPLPAIERLARGLEQLVVPAGETVFTQGDIGDRYFVIESGEAEVSATDTSSRRSDPGRGSGRSPCCAAFAGRPPCEPGASSISRLCARTTSSRSCSASPRALARRDWGSTSMLGRFAPDDEAERPP